MMKTTNRGALAFGAGGYTTGLHILNRRVSDLVPP
ncbi:hypothetical protein HYPGJ_20025 [Hyphomicrobium sp. GJ21]|nr:hypothetical protein HYPGJ_20025 [Hyphomicrobium sp. GJ21]